MVGIGDIADQLNIDPNRDAVRKGVENERPGMRKVELQMRGRVRSSELRLAVLGLHELDGCWLDPQPLTEESSQTRACDDVVLPVLCKTESVGSLTFVARQQ